MKPSKIILLSTMVLLNSIAFSQNKGKDGYVVTNSNDTLKGLVSFKNNSTSPTKITINANGLTTTYLPKQLKSFAVKTDQQELYFKTVITQLHQFETDLSKLTNSPEPKFKLSNDKEPKFLKDTIFVQIIVMGSKNLYFHKDDIGNEHYLIDDATGNVTDLIYKRFYIDKDMTKLAYNEQYKNQLMSILTNCSSINFDRVTALKFSKEKLSDLFLEYNNCNSTSQNTYTLKTEKISFQFGATVGTNQSKLKFSSDGNKISQTQLNPSTSFNFGLYANIVFPKAKRSWSFYNELLFNQYKYSGTGYNIYYENPEWYKKITNVEIAASSIKLFTALRYQLPAYQLKPFLQMGVGNGFSFNTSSKSITETRFNSDITYEPNEFMEFRKYEQSLFIGLGLSYKKIGCEFRYEAGNGMTQVSGISSKTRYMYFLLNLRF